jgi:cytoskeletal protein CcmA (bactofilin family)
MYSRIGADDDWRGVVAAVLGGMRGFASPLATGAVVYYLGNTPTGFRERNAMPQLRLAPLGIVTLAAGLTACGETSVEINGQPGVPLAEVEMTGAAPTEVVLSSGDTVILAEGNTFDIKVEGPDTDSLRFVRDAELIGVTRDKDWKGESKATIRITMPAPREVVIAGSGTIKAAGLASTSEIVIGGAGTVEFGEVAAEKLGINIGGSGTVRGAGTVKRLEVNIGGTGDVELPGLKADDAEVAIGGSGDVAFASDGTVEANIAGAGDVKVAGSAKCTVNAFGSGTLTCTPGGGGGASAALPAPPEAPAKPAE